MLALVLFARAKPLNASTHAAHLHRPCLDLAAKTPAHCAVEISFSLSLTSEDACDWARWTSTSSLGVSKIAPPSFILSCVRSRQRIPSGVTLWEGAVFGRETAKSPSAFRSCRLYDFSGLLRGSVCRRRGSCCRPWDSCGFEVSVCSLLCSISLHLLDDSSPEAGPPRAGEVTDDAVVQCQRRHARLTHANPSELSPMLQRLRRLRLWLPSRRWRASRSPHCTCERAL